MSRIGAGASSLTWLAALAARSAPVALLAGCALFALLSDPLPSVQGLDAPAQEFSAARAFAHVEAIAASPHPVGSDAHARVRGYLLETLAGLGLEPVVQAGDLEGVSLANVLARVEGRASRGTVLLLAHYDSRRSTPGAGDDTVGVASWLEALRALRAGAAPSNTLLLLLSDGEEAGLLGAELFARDHPWFADVKVVVNLEAIGNGGPAVLFETGGENGELVRLYARSVDRPSGTSLANAIYRRLPNDTDFSVFRERGLSGFNLALTRGTCAYHAPHDTPENLDPRSLQHMGDCALALVRALGEIDLGSLDAPDATFFDLLGRTQVSYPASYDAWLAGAALVLAALRRELRGGACTPLAVAGWLVRWPLEALLVGGLALFAWWGSGGLVRLFAAEQGAPPGNTTSGALLALGIVSLVAGLELFLAGRFVRAQRSSSSRFLAVALWWCVLALGAERLLPGASFAFLWPLSIATIAFLAAPDRAAGSVRVLSLSALSIGLLVFALPILHALVQLFHREEPRAASIGVFLAVIGAGLLTPLTRALGEGSRAPARILFLAGLASLFASAIVAHLLAWRGGALWPSEGAS